MCSLLVSEKISSEIRLRGCVISHHPGVIGQPYPAYELVPLLSLRFPDGERGRLIHHRFGATYRFSVL